MRWVLLAVGTLAAGGAQAEDPVAEGRAVAGRWCAACHAVPGLPASDTAASFTAIARREAMTPAALAVAIGDPHPRMPDPPLTRDQLEAVIAYIGSLR